MTQDKRNSAAILIFSSLGHLLNHVCIAFYFVIVLALETEWRLPYHDLIELWTLGALMVGVAALPAGLLGDRIGAPAMMVIYFLGMGGCAMGAGSADSSAGMFVWLTGIGVFAAIYHPVCIPWLVRNSNKAKGRTLAFNGVFGSLGGAAAGISAGWLIHVSSWRAAFLVPGIFCVVLGLALLICIGQGMIGDREQAGERRRATPGKRNLVIVFCLLTVSMFLAGLIFHGTQAALPKLLELRHEGLISGGALGVGVLVAMVYTAAAVMQFVGGALADRYPLKYVYMGAILVEVPLLALAASQGGAALLLLAVLMVSANAAALPAENMLLAQYAPVQHHGLAFGAKFVLAFGAAPLAVQLVAYVHGQTGEFYWLFMTLTLLACLAFTAAASLPRPAACIVQTA